jgi:hypothetical protein
VIARLVRRAGRLALTPASEWEAIHTEGPTWQVSLGAYALPLALLPALGWASGLALNPVDDPRVVGGAAGFALSFVQTLTLSVLNVGVLALGFYLLLPLYDLRRDWNAAAAAAAYGSTPVLLSGILLVVPVLVMISLLGLLHCFYLYYLGAIRLLGCRPSEAAGFVAAGCVFTVFVSALIAALASSLGVI